MRDEWISVKERLPITVETKIITMMYGKYKVVSFGWYSPKSEAWNLLDDSYLHPREPDNFKVIAWMDTPEEYKGE